MRAPGHILVRLETEDGSAKFRLIRQDILRRAHEHECRIWLARAFGLDEITTWFELPESFKGAVQGHRIAGRELDGRVYCGPKEHGPIGKITICNESDKFKDGDKWQ